MKLEREPWPGLDFGFLSRMAFISCLYMPSFLKDWVVVTTRNENRLFCSAAKYFQYLHWKVNIWLFYWKSRFLFIYHFLITWPILYGDKEKGKSSSWSLSKYIHFHISMPFLSMLASPMTHFHTWHFWDTMQMKKYDWNPICSLNLWLIKANQVSVHKNWERPAVLLETPFCIWYMWEMLSANTQIIPWLKYRADAIDSVASQLRSSGGPASAMEGI